jgi:hypothetical protein
MGLGGIFAPIGLEGMSMIFTVVVYFLNAHFSFRKKKSREQSIDKQLCIHVYAIMVKWRIYSS